MRAWLDTLTQDLRYGARQLRRNPGFTVTAVLSLALGIGANAAIFTLLDQIVLRLLPVENPRALTQLQITGGRFGSNNGDGRGTFSYPLYLFLREKNTVFSGLAGAVGMTANRLAATHNEAIGLNLVSGNYFDVLGVKPYLGRLLSLTDDRVRLGSPVVVLQYDYWRQHLAADPAVVGSTLNLGGAPFTVIGVAAPGFEGTDTGLPTQAWVPVNMLPVIAPNWDSMDNERFSWFYLFGRLKPGMSSEQAQASLRVLYRQRQEEEVKRDLFLLFPDQRERFLRQTFSLIPAERGYSYLRRRFERPLIVLQWLVGLVLLLACANVASLLLARSTARQRELAIRGALGARRAQLARQLFSESALLAVGGGAAGLLLGYWLTRVLVRFMPVDAERLSITATPDVRVLGFTLFVTVATVFVFGLLPAWRGASVSPATTMKEEAGAVVGGHGHVRLRKTLVGLQVALACLLLAGAGFFVRTLDRLRQVDLGFRTDHVVMFNARPAAPIATERKLLVYRSLIEQLGAAPGVIAVGGNRTNLLTGGRWDNSITVPGYSGPDGEGTWSYFNAVTPGYFDSLRIPLRMGRGFNWNDWGSTRKRCIVNETLAKQYLGETAIGRQIGRGRRAEADMDVVGVIADAHYDEVRGTVPRQVFVLADDRVGSIMSINVYARVAGDPYAIMPRLRDTVRRVDSSLVVSSMHTLDDQLDRSLANERLLAMLSSGFAFLAALLAVVGLNGVLAFVVVRRTREIGIRVALGAERPAVLRLVFAEVVPVVLAGLVVGTVAAVVSARYVESQLFGVKANDPLVFAAAVALLLPAAVGAAFLPAWRAARIDPLSALRHE